MPSPYGAYEDGKYPTTNFLITLKIHKQFCLFCVKNNNEDDNLMSNNISMNE